jgi:3-hydroxy-9,10-secoandrosta-1,3,5(10)-triene-9,17-dione monooxygenase reductase component
MGQFATGVAVVTTRGPAGLTTNAFTSLSLEPPLVLVCLDRESRTLAAVREQRRLAVNVLAAAQQELAVKFAGKAAHEEKFADAGWREEGGVPVLDGVVAWVAGTVRELILGCDNVLAIV